MLVGKLFERIDQGEKIQDIALELELNPSTLRRKLNTLGYAWDNSAKVWNYQNEGDQPLDVDIMTLVNKPNNNTVNENENKAVVVPKQVTKINVVTKSVDEFDFILKDKIKSDKVQKGIYFDPEVAKALDQLVKRKLQSEFVNAAVKKILKEKNLL